MRVTPMDSTFLYTERPEAPMHVGAVILVELPENFEGSFFDAYKDVLKARAEEMPFFFAKLDHAPLNIGYPVWVKDEDYDWDYHVRHTALPKPGTMEQLYEKVARIHSRSLDMTRPLAEYWVIEGLENGMVALYSKTHHACLDGQRGAALAQFMFDLTPEPRGPLNEEQREALGINLEPAEKQTIVDHVVNAVFDNLKRPFGASFRPALKVAQAMIEQNNRAKETDMPTLTAPKTILNQRIGKERSFYGRSFGLKTIKDIRKASGYTINEVMVAVAGGGLRRYLEEKGELPEESLVCGAPVALGITNESANNTTMMTLSFGTHIEDPMERLEFISKTSNFGKESTAHLQEAINSGAGLKLPAWITQPLLGTLTSPAVMDRMPTAMNAVLSNVKGVPFPLYIAGAKIVAQYPVSIVTHGAGVNLTCQSYMDQMDFGIVACKKTMPDPERLMDLISEELEHIHKVTVTAANTGVTPPPVGDDQEAKAA